MKKKKSIKNLDEGPLSMPTIVTSLSEPSGEKPKLSATEILAEKNKGFEPNEKKE